MSKRHGLHSFDLRGIADPAHRAVVQGALNACDYPLQRIRRAKGVRVPVTVADTSRGVAAGDEAAEHAAGVHPLTDPEARHTALGLFWLPTDDHPAGRVELSQDIMGDVALAQEVFVAEAAHAVDYAVLTDAQRAELFAIVHHGDATAHGTHAWFEERGGQDYWSDWVGEVFMGLFMRAFAPGLPRPLAARQPWVHQVDDAMAAQARVVLLRKP